MKNYCGISDYDLYLFHEGRHFHSYQILGAHFFQQGGKEGVRFAVWAPNASEVRVVGDFNSWQGDLLKKVGDSGIWALFIPGLDSGVVYKYELVSRDGRQCYKADPYAFWAEMRPNSASKVFPLNNYLWNDGEWCADRVNGVLNRPAIIYEMHLGSWRRKPDGGFYTYREIADDLIRYVQEMGYTHIELLPLAEHPLDASWGYQITGYYAPTSRYGSPDDLKYLVDKCHQGGIGVILDWVPGHFCKDDHGLAQFDGEPLYESGYSSLAENQGWGTLNFDFCRPEVWSFLISNAVYWLDVFHIDGLRVDAVANMIYRDYGKKKGDWLPNIHGGREDLEAVDFLKKLNEAIHQQFPGSVIIAEESTTWPMITKPVYLGGLGFDYKWNMGWMNDTLKYMSLDSIHRKWDHNLLTFSFLYAFSENFILPLSHDEVVHGKKSLLDKMPGDYWQKFANLRAFYGYFMAHPGKKLIFMGGEFGQFAEWNEDWQLDWMLLDYDMHGRLKQYVRDLNHYYRSDPAFWLKDDDWHGFEWIDCHDYSQSTLSFLRKSGDDQLTIVVCNFTPVVRYDFRVGVPKAGRYREVLNSDLPQYGGSNLYNPVKTAEEIAWHNRDYSISITIPPLATIYIRFEPETAD